MQKTCKQCGKTFDVFRGQSLRREYCSDECRDKASGRIRYKQGATGICKECGKEFIKQYGNERFCSDECRYKSKRQSAARSYKKLYLPKPPKFTACAVCGAETDGNKYCSAGCECKAAYKRKKVREFGTWENYQTILKEAQDALKAEQERKREARKPKPIGKTCAVCGAKFETLNPAQRTCSKRCGKRLSYARKQHRIPKEQIIDKDITLEALYKRDSGVCYLCGGVCDWEDKNEKGCGSCYPSIDHVTPISRGGLHSWSNVKLAHLACNIAKSDDVITGELAAVPANAYKFKRETKRKPPKRTEQYTKDGRLVAVFSSTGEAEAKTKIPKKMIQKAARGECPTAYGYVWKYRP